MKKLTMMVGPPGSGKSTIARTLCQETGAIYINQDSQGKEHLAIFDEAVIAGKNVVVDRMNFDRKQRGRYLGIAKDFGYQTEIRVFHQPYEVCLDRMAKREGHETIKNEESARSALQVFFTKYERVEDEEADKVTRFWPEGEKPEAIICDLDGTLADCLHRMHHIMGKRDWPAFFAGIKDDTPNKWCADILNGLRKQYEIVYCTGRTEEYRKQTQHWLTKHGLWQMCRGNLIMRPSGDYRKGPIIKETLLDFEILTKFKPCLMIDDNKDIVAMWRKRGYTCLDCGSYGDF